MNNFKICTVCKLLLSLNKFNKRAAKKDKKRSECKDCQSIYRKKYREKNIKKAKEKSKEFYYLSYQNCPKYKKHKKEYDKVYRKKKLKTDIQYKLRLYLRKRIWNILKNNYKAGSSIHDLGCSINELIKHLESKFYPNLETNEMMTWKNYGFRGWHIDHIIPLSSFDLTDREQFLKACNYTNLQPLWAKDNLIKGAKIKHNIFLDIIKI